MVSSIRVRVTEFILERYVSSVAQDIRISGNWGRGVALKISTEGTVLCLIAVLENLVSGFTNM